MNRDFEARQKGAARLVKEDERLAKFEALLWRSRLNQSRWPRLLHAEFG